MRSTTRKRIEACKRVSAPQLPGKVTLKHEREVYSAYVKAMWPYNPVPIEEPPKRSIWCGLFGR